VIFEVPVQVRVEVNYVNDELDDSDVGTVLYLRTGYSPVMGILHDYGHRLVVVV
jgi:hypothetical protein